MADISGAVAVVVQKINDEVDQRCPRATVKLRNAELKVLANPSHSAPGQPPGVRSGDLRRDWTFITSDRVVGISSETNYAGYLENGTYKMAARPYKQRIIDRALPEITAIFEEPY